ncbi:MAG TPA: hydroxymethylbilane synthase, partial [Pirellulaceae bacterium]|nr:hydroxymethylbilane synthase [Pirellulaceae bacterium]
LDSGDYEAIVLAEAGLTRLGLSERILQVLPKSVMLPAVGQGALALETRTSDEATRAAVAKLDDAETHAAVVAERALLATLRGGCLAPVGAWGRVEGGALKLDAVVLSPDGRERRYGQIEGAPADAANLGRDLAERLAAEGARDLIAASRA